MSHFNLTHIQNKFMTIKLIIMILNIFIELEQIYTPLQYKEMKNLQLSDSTLSHNASQNTFVSHDRWSLLREWADIDGKAGGCENNSYVHMHCRSQETLSLGPSKFRNNDPLTTTRVHTQLNYTRKLQVDQAVVVKTGSTQCMLGSHDRNYVHGKCRPQPLREHKRVFTRKCTVIGEVTPNFELAKRRGLCVHTSANFKCDPPRLVVCRTNLKILSWFRNLKLTSSYETTSRPHAP